jgi:hypothetical protein
VGTLKIGKHVFTFNVVFVLTVIGLAVSACFYYQEKVATELDWPRYEVCLESAANGDSEVVKGVQAGVKAWDDGFARAGRRHGFRFIQAKQTGGCGISVPGHIVIIDDFSGQRYPEADNDVLAKRHDNGKTIIYSERIRSTFDLQAAEVVENLTVHHIGSDLKARANLTGDVTPSPDDLTALCAANGC